MSLADHLRHLEESLLSPAVRKDRATLSALLAEGFREIGSSGRIFSRAGILGELQAEPSLHTVTLTDFECTLLSDTLALVTYRTLRLASEPVLETPPVVARRSSLWVLRDARWQILFHQGTLVP